MAHDACPTEHELLARARAVTGDDPASGEVERPHDDVDEHLAECSECRIVVSELARATSSGSQRTTGSRQTTGPASDVQVTKRGARAQVDSGDVIDGKYRIDEVLGRGGMGLVLGATHQVLGSRVAIKVPTLDVRDDPDARARLLREARLVARLEGEYVGRVLDAGILPGGFPFIVFEHLTGWTLAERLGADGRLSVSEAVDAVIEACAGLAVAHAAGVVHRDVKPSNLFEATRADGSHAVRVIDFGIARAYADGDAVTRSRVVVGTPAYMAPEQAVAARQIDARADVWAIGVTLLELLTGRLLGSGGFAPKVDDAAALAREIPGGRREASLLARVVARCLCERVDDRYPNVGALAEALAPLAGERGRDALRSLAREAKRSRGGGAPRGAVAGGIAAAALVVGFIALRSGRHPAPVEMATATTDPVTARPVSTAAPPAAPTVHEAAEPPRAAPVVVPPAHPPATTPVRRASRSAPVSPAVPVQATPPSVAAAPAPSVRDSNGLDDRK
ncbi:MAG TPA: serine/threonine-protein kinase [Polyangiaceae bacterium]|jgi:serine/threonine-protein kinase